MKQVVIMPGGFHPFHAGHYALYQQAQQAFPGADVYVAATADTSTRPFPFPLKQKLAKLAGVPADRFVQVKSPFSAQEITAGYNPEDTAVIFVRSEKDRNAVPQPAKRDANGNLPLVTRGPRKGQPVSDYLQFYTGEENLAPMNQHAYIDYLPTVEFGPGMTSATEIRNAWPKLNEKRKTALVMSLYPKTQKNPALAANVVKMLDTVLGAELDEDLSRRGILKGLAGAGALEFQPQQQVNEFAPSGEGGNGPFDYGSAIIKIGETFDDQFPGEGSGQDSADIINVGKTFMTAGMKPGIMALFDLDTMVYEQVLDELTDQDFNVQQDLYQPYLTYMNAGTAPSGTAPAGNAPGTLYLPANSNETQIILALLKEFIKVHQNDQEYRQAVEGIYKAFQQSLQAGFQALNTAWDLNIDADFGQFAGRYGVDLNAIADRHGLSDEDDDDDLEEGVAEDTAGPVEAWGYVYDRRDQRVMWRKIFPSAEAAHKWADSKNATVLGTRSVEQPVAEAKKVSKATPAMKELLSKVTERKKDSESNDRFVDYSKLHDPELIKAKQYAKVHYPGYTDDPEVAFDKWVQRSLQHSEEEDQIHDKKLKQLSVQVQQLQKEIDQLNAKPDYIEEKWSEKYKRSIDCSHPKGFSQRAHCAGRKK